MEKSRNQNRSIYLIGAVATIFVLGGIILDMIVGSIITGGDISTIPQTALERFKQFNDNWALGLYNLDLLNVIIQIFTIPSIFAIYIAHKRTDNGYALLALILFLIGATIFVSGNTALPMLELSEKYFTANSDIQKSLIAAGEAMLARGAHGSLGVFIGFALPTFSNILMSHVMIKGQIFTKTTSFLGFIGNILLLIYIVMVTFFPATEKFALMIAMPGGLLALGWIFMYMIKLFKLGGK